MTSDAQAGSRILGSLRSADGTGIVRVEDRYDTDLEDLWSALTEPRRLARWIADVEGDLRLDGEFSARFTSGWEGTGRVVVCEPPRRLLVQTRETGEAREQAIEATLTADGDRTILVIEERGLRVEHLAAYGAGWQVHAEDLAAHLAAGERCDMKARWSELISAYREQAAGLDQRGPGMP
jgi:uncharacterized protein YndB with AHSA1/START domain